MDGMAESIGFLCMVLLAVLHVFVFFAAIMLVILLLLLYGGAIIAMTAALFKRARSGDAGGDGGLPGVSIVIPFRDEERNLGALLESLGKQSYKGMMEVILVNDQSGDNWAEVVDKYCQRNDHIPIKIIDLEPSSDIKLSSKQQAIDLGVSHSSHPLIAFTDADMILAPGWVESLVNSQVSTGSDLIFGHTSIITENTKSLFTMMEAYQLEYLFAFACAFSKLGLTGSCMGNNILVVRDSYLKCGGQRGVGYSIVEDRALLELFRKKKLKTAAAEPFTVTARTYPSQSKTQFLNQMMRWARGGLRPGGGLFFAGLLLLTQNVVFLWAVLGTAIGIATSHAVNPLIAGLSVLNFLLTWLFLSLSFRKHRSPAPKLLYPAYYLFMMAETAVFGLLLIFRPKIKWKNRKL